VAGKGESTVRQVSMEHVEARSPHRHPKSEEIVYVVAGRGRVWLDGSYHQVGPGSWYRIPAGTPHATLPDPGEQMSLVCFFPHDEFADNIEELDMVLEPDEEESHE
jgi:quercetin dioxygenase-like cupin family protein